jgi:hypothetical protein
VTTSDTDRVCVVVVPDDTALADGLVIETVALMEQAVAARTIAPPVVNVIFPALSAVAVSVAAAVAIVKPVAHPKYSAADAPDSAIVNEGRLSMSLVPWAVAMGLIKP